MKIKKYIATTMPEAMQKIRADLGPEAVILNSKQIRQGGFLGLFQQKKIEVVAALDPKPLTTEEDQLEQKEFMFQKEQHRVNEENQVLKEINQLKKLIANQSKRSSEDYPLEYQKAYDYLCDQEVNDDLANEIINEIMVKHKEERMLFSDEIILADMKANIEEKLKKTAFNGITYEQKIIQFVGPTGVGKTTTLAKVAAESILKDHKKVAFITSDTYRIGAIEQLKTYARILDVPLEVAYTKDDYDKALMKFADSDLILVDTAGRNFRDDKYVKALWNHSEFNIRTYLVLSLTAKPADITAIYNQFKNLKIKEVIFTKLDETTQYGSILNIALNHQVGIAYLTNGQDVPEDLLKPSATVVSDYILSGYLDE